MKKCLLEECQTLTENPKFCSLSCGAKFQQRNKVRSIKTRLCAREDCDKEFAVVAGKYENKYCSRSCAATVNNRKSPKRVKNSASNAGTGFCARCKAPATKKFCSRFCSTAYIKESKLASWLDGSWDGTTQTGLSSAIRNYLIEQAENRCTSPTCAVPGGFAEINPVTGRCPLEVDHLDGNCYNNTRENLMVVCPNCHALTPTYRALNKGSGRAYRRSLDV